MNTFEKFWDWVKTTFNQPYQDEIHRYLSQSVDHKDLESRMYFLQRRGML